MEAPDEQPTPIDVIYRWYLDKTGGEAAASTLKFVQCTQLLNELAEAGLSVVEIGEVPPWMKLVTAQNLTHDDGSGWFENVYRLVGEGDSPIPSTEED